MSKDFEQAYKELANNEIPDLWDRIEAGLKEKSAPEQNQEENKKIAVEADGGKKKKPFSFRRYAKVAAAVIGAAVIIPAYLNITKTKGASFSGMASGGATQEAYDTAAAAECAPEEVCATEEAEGADEAAPENAGSVEDLGEQEKMEKEMAAQDEMSAKDAERASGGAAMDNGAPAAESSGSETGKIESSDTDSGDGQSSSRKEQGTKGLEDGMVLSLTVEVTTKETVYDDENEELPFGTLFTAIIQEDDSGLFEKGEQLEIYIPVYSSQMLTIGSAFEVDVIYESDEKHPFRLQLCRGLAGQ